MSAICCRTCKIFGEWSKSVEAEGDLTIDGRSGYWSTGTYDCWEERIILVFSADADGRDAWRGRDADLGSGGGVELRADGWLLR